MAFSVLPRACLMEWLASQPPFVIYGGAFAFGVGLVFCLFRMASEREPPVAFAKPAEPPKVVEVKDMKAEGAQPRHIPAVAAQRTLRRSLHTLRGPYRV